MHAVAREPAPLTYFKRIQLGDVGYIRKGCFHLLFSAGCSLDTRQLGVDVPHTFKQLDVGLIPDAAQPRPPGYLSTNTVREIPAHLRSQTHPTPYVRFVASASSKPSDVCSRMWEPGSRISFRLTGAQGAALLTKHETYSEDIQRERTFEEYTKEHYGSWVAFARETGHGNDIKPVLVTGVDMTRDFAMISYSNNDGDLASEFSISVPGVASAWGIWRTTGVIYKNCGPQPRRPRYLAQTADLTSSDSSHTETTLDEFNQCVFVRYYTMRKRLGIPRVIKAAAGPHDLSPGDRDDEESPLEVQCNSDSGSDTVSSLFDDGGDDDRNSVSSIDSGSDIVVRNTVAAVRSSSPLPILACSDWSSNRAKAMILIQSRITSSRQVGDRSVGNVKAPNPPALELRCRVYTHPPSRHRTTS